MGQEWERARARAGAGEGKGGESGGGSKKALEGRKGVQKGVGGGVEVVVQDGE